MSKIGDYLFSGVFATMGLGVGVFTLFSASEEMKPLDTLEPLDGSRLSALKRGEPVLVETKLDNDHPPFQKHLIAGCEQNYVSDDDGGSWEDGTPFNQPLHVTYGSTRITLDLHSPCPRGTHGTVDNPKDDDHRWVGYRNGDKITAVGKVKSLAPIEVRVKRHYGGTVADYRSMLNTVRIIGPIAGSVFFGLGVFLIYRTRRKYGNAQGPGVRATKPHVAPDWVKPTNSQFANSPRAIAASPQASNQASNQTPNPPPGQWPGPPPKDS